MCSVLSEKATCMSCLTPALVMSIYND
jgi:hypothetical protein